MSYHNGPDDATNKENQTPDGIKEEIERQSANVPSKNLSLSSTALFSLAFRHFPKHAEVLVIQGEGSGRDEDTEDQRERYVKNEQVREEARDWEGLGKDNDGRIFYVLRVDDCPDHRQALLWHPTAVSAALGFLDRGGKHFDSSSLLQRDEEEEVGKENAGGKRRKLKVQEKKERWMDEDDKGERAEKKRGEEKERGLALSTLTLGPPISSNLRSISSATSSHSFLSSPSTSSSAFSSAYLSPISTSSVWVKVNQQEEPLQIRRCFSSEESQGEKARKRGEWGDLDAFELPSQSGFKPSLIPGKGRGLVATQSWV